MLNKKSIELGIDFLGKKSFRNITLPDTSLHSGKPNPRPNHQKPNGTHKA